MCFYNIILMLVLVVVFIVATQAGITFWKTLIVNLYMIMQLKNVRVCGPRYWPQVIHLVPEGI